MIGDRVKAARKHSGLSQTALATAINRDQTTVSRMERGADVRVRDLRAVAIACGVSWVWLSTGRGDMTPPAEPDGASEAAAPAPEAA